MEPLELCALDENRGVRKDPVHDGLGAEEGHSGAGLQHRGWRAGEGGEETMHKQGERRGGPAHLSTEAIFREKY